MLNLRCRGSMLHERRAMGPRLVVAEKQSGIWHGCLWTPESHSGRRLQRLIPRTSGGPEQSTPRDSGSSLLSGTAGRASMLPACPQRAPLRGNSRG